ncbi:MAG: tRNA (N6-isopentenyl adenosine(37)-C2)-methylthiotransferase MiaB, partial [Sphaerochaetaceae bacterium]|nr:tRNA (N6-isopentenyl adenosine(37)-C2)-methylthiotransferase MiaB [Sphaerochaetaceae bacterium]
MNVAESNALEALFLQSGWTEAKVPEDANVAIINTCSVRKSAENRIWGRLGAYKYMKMQWAKEGKKKLLFLTGCMAQRLFDSIKKDAPQIDYVVQINDKLKIVEIANKEMGVINERVNLGCENYNFTSSYYKEGDFSSYVPIMNGCNNFCTYCIVPYVRGREVSRCPEEIVKEIEFLDKKRVREITLLGQNVNSYNYEGMTFPQLLELISLHCHNIKWIRFDSPHPKDFSNELIKVIATNNKVAKHLHIPMQSGNSRILNLMNRRYSREKYLELIRKIKEANNDITFAVDVMVAFPSETEEEFNDTISAMDEVGYIEAYMYYWNPREGTKACSMEG